LHEKVAGRFPAESRTGRAIGSGGDSKNRPAAAKAGFDFAAFRGAAEGAPFQNEFDPTALSKTNSNWPRF